MKKQKCHFFVFVFLCTKIYHVFIPNNLISAVILRFGAGWTHTSFFWDFFFSSQVSAKNLRRSKNKEYIFWAKSSLFFFHMTSRKKSILHSSILTVLLKSKQKTKTKGMFKKKKNLCCFCVLL